MTQLRFALPHPVCFTNLSVANSPGIGFLNIAHPLITEKFWTASQKFSFCITQALTIQMAQFIAEGSQLTGAEVRLRSIEKRHGSSWCEGMALGSPTHYGCVSWQMKQWWDEQPIENWGMRDGKIGCVFRPQEPGEEVRGPVCPCCRS